MRSSFTFLALVALASSLNGVTGSVFLPHAGGSRSVHPAPSSSALYKKDFSYGSRTSGGRRVPIAASAMKGTAMAIPGYIVGYCLFNYAIPKPDKDFFFLYYQIMYGTFFEK